jgi:hypothetical protein
MYILTLKTQKMTENQLNYLRIINTQLKTGKIKKKDYKRELKWFRKTIKKHN